MFWRAIRDRMESLLFGQPNATLRRLLSDQGAKHWKGYAFSFAMMGLIALTTSLSAWIIGKIVDKIFVGHNLSAVWEITAAIVAIYAVKGFATYGQQVSLSRVANSIVADIQTRIFDKMLRMNVAYYSKSHSSEFIARQSFIAGSASNALNLLITTLSRDALTIVGLVIVMVSQDPMLTVLALMLVPVAALGVRQIGQRVRRIMSTEFAGAMQMMESLQETAQGVRIVKAFTLEDFMRQRQGAAIRGFQTAANKLASVSSRTSPIMESLGGFAIAAVVLYSGYTVIIRGNQPGSLFSFITSVIMLYEPMKRVARFHVDMSSSLFGVSMLYDFLDAREFEEDPPGARELEITEGRMEFRNVVFGYRPEERVLHSVSFVAEAGKTTALVGRSGGGKSTVMALILRLYDIEAGQILCDGVDIASVTRNSVRRQIGYVAQENFLFKGSVRDNIAMGRPGASEEDIVSAAKAAYAARLHHGVRARLRHALRRARHAAIRRPAPAHRHRPRLSQGRADHPARRGDLRPRLRIRAGDPESAAHPVRRPHHHRHRPSPLDGRPGRRDLCDRPRPDRGARPPPRSARPGPHLQPDREDPVSKGRGVVGCFRRPQVALDHLRCGEDGQPFFLLRRQRDRSGGRPRRGKAPAAPEKC